MNWKERKLVPRQRSCCCFGQSKQTRSKKEEDYPRSIFTPLQRHCLCGLGWKGASRDGLPCTSDTPPWAKKIILCFFVCAENVEERYHHRALQQQQQLLFQPSVSLNMNCPYHRTEWLSHLLFLLIYFVSPTRKQAKSRSCPFFFFLLPMLLFWFSFPFPLERNERGRLADKFP